MIKRSLTLFILLVFSGCVPFMPSMIPAQSLFSTGGSTVKIKETDDNLKVKTNLKKDSNVKITINSELTGTTVLVENKKQ